MLMQCYTCMAVQPPDPLLPAPPLQPPLNPLHQHQRLVPQVPKSFAADQNSLLHVACYKGMPSCSLASHTLHKLREEKKGLVMLQPSSCPHILTPSQPYILIHTLPPHILTPSPFTTSYPHPSTPHTLTPSSLLLLYTGAYQEALMLLLSGHDASARNIWLETPLHQCTAQGHLELIMLLLDAGTDVNSADHQSMTPLHQAIIHGNRDAAELLLCYGASVYNAEGVTDTLSALELADHVHVCHHVITSAEGEILI